MMPDDAPRFRAAYWRTLRALDDLRLRYWEASRITLPQLRVLYQIRRTPGITTTELARRLGVTLSTASGLVIKLSDRGLVSRAAAPDRRQELLSLTAEGEAQASGLAETSREYLDRVGARLGDRLPATIARLEDLAAAAEAIHQETRLLQGETQSSDAKLQRIDPTDPNTAPGRPGCG